MEHPAIPKVLGFRVLNYFHWGLRGGSDYGLMCLASYRSLKDAPMALARLVCLTHRLPLVSPGVPSSFRLACLSHSWQLLI